jgi:glycosyltransferase involved in cell wall biosynthesis
MHKPLVTVGIPTFNQPQYIEKSLQSVLAQTYPNLEVIVVEDSAHPEAVAKIEELQEKYPQVQFHINAGNLGRVKNYHQILYTLASGDYYLNLDGDDYFTDTDFIADAMTAILSFPVKDVLFYQGGHILKRAGTAMAKLPTINQEVAVFSAGEYFLRFFSVDHFSHLGTVYNRQLACQSGFYQHDVLSTDIFSFHKLCLNHPAKKVILAKKIAGVWLHHGSNISTTNKAASVLQNSFMYQKLFWCALSKPVSKVRLLRWWFSATYFGTTSLLKSFIR